MDINFVVQLSSKKLKKPFPKKFDYFTAVIGPDTNALEIKRIYFEAVNQIKRRIGTEKIFVHCDTGID